MSKDNIIWMQQEIKRIEDETETLRELNKGWKYVIPISFLPILFILIMIIISIIE